MAVSVFGKSPVRGDFISRGTPPDLEAAWRAWIAAGFELTRNCAGGDWLSAYRDAPLWRFALAPAPAACPALCGVMAASADAEGRAFPLTIFAAYPEGAGAPPGMAQLFAMVNRWAPAAEEAVLSTGAHDADYAALVASLEELDRLWAEETGPARRSAEDPRGEGAGASNSPGRGVLSDAVGNLGPGRLFWFADEGAGGGEAAFGMLHHPGALDPQDWLTLLRIDVADRRVDEGRGENE